MGPNDSTLPQHTSPAQLLFGREIRDGLPTPIEHYKPALRAKVERRLRQVRLHQDPHSSRHELPILDPGQPVVVQNPLTKRWTDHGIIIGFGQNSREYVVELKRNGKRYVRNRRFMKPDLQARFQAPAPEPSAETLQPAPETQLEPSLPLLQPTHATPERAGSQPSHAGPPANMPVPPAPITRNHRPSRTIIKPARFRDETNTVHRRAVTWAGYNPVHQM